MSVRTIPLPPKLRPLADVDAEADTGMGGPNAARTEQSRQAKAMNRKAWNEHDAYVFAAAEENQNLQSQAASFLLRDQQILDEQTVLDGETQKTEQEVTGLQTLTATLRSQRDASILVFNKLVAKLGKVEPTRAGLEIAIYRINQALDLLNRPNLEAAKRAPGMWWELPAFLLIAMICAVLSSLSFVTIFGGHHNLVAHLQITPPLLLGIAFATMLIVIIGGSAEHLTKTGLEDLRLRSRLSLGVNLGIALIAFFVALEALGDGVGLFMIAQRSLLLSFSEMPTWLIALITCPLALLISLPPVSFKVMRIWSKERTYEAAMCVFEADTKARAVMTTSVVDTFDSFANMEPATESATQIELLDGQIREQEGAIVTKRNRLAEIASKQTALSAELRTLAESQTIPAKVLQRFEDHAARIRGLMQQVEALLKA